MMTWSISGMSSPLAAKSVHTRNCCSPSRNLSKLACLILEIREGRISYKLENGRVNGNSQSVVISGLRIVL